MDIPIIILKNTSNLTIKKRPSSTCKSPYVADANETNELLHAPSLSCGGLVDKDSSVVCSRKHKQSGKCKYLVQLGFDSESNAFISTNPLLANKITNSLLLNKFLKMPFTYNRNNIHPEYTIGNSRFDFVIKDDNKTYIIEVKAVPIAVHENLTIKELSKKDFTGYNPKKKIGVFPIGYRKSKNVPISERAIKHLDELGNNLEEGKAEYACCLFIVGREDVVSFQPSMEDLFYLTAMKKAIKKGVKIRAVKMIWRNGCCYFGGELPVIIPE
jgi:DNA-binding sugar fermentation-stimulating protein